jgi:hypothetical protein
MKDRSKYHEPYEPVTVVVREAEGVGRKAVRDLFRPDTRRLERTGPGEDDWHKSKLTRPSLASRVARRRRRNQLAKASRRRNR